jgi:hypothetical protein
MTKSSTPTKAELHAMLAEAVRNTQPQPVLPEPVREAQPAPKRKGRTTPKRAAKIKRARR